MFASPKFIYIIVAVAAFLSACSRSAEPVAEANVLSATPAQAIVATPVPTPSRPNLQAELLDDRNKTTTSPIGKFDFKNYTFELPRGWQNPDGTAEIKLTNGKIAPVDKKVTEDMPDEERAEAKQQRRIGMSYVATKFFDVTGDGQDEAVVILKVETGGSAVPQLVYVFSWKDGKPELIWPFRTGDRADGGLKDVRSENGEIVVELYGQDRFLLGQTETGKITGDIEQLCCPTYFTRTRYKWNGNAFLMQGKRLTYSTANPTAAPLENYGDVVNNPGKFKR